MGRHSMDPELGLEDLMAAQYAYGAPEASQEFLAIRQAMAEKQSELHYSPLHDIWLDEQGYAVDVADPLALSFELPSQRDDEAVVDLIAHESSSAQQQAAEYVQISKEDQYTWNLFLQMSHYYGKQPGGCLDQLLSGTPAGNFDEMKRRINAVNLIETRVVQQALKEEDLQAAQPAEEIHRVDEQKLREQEEDEFTRRRALKATDRAQEKLNGRPKVSVRMPDLIHDGLSFPELQQLPELPKPTDIYMPSAQYPEVKNENSPESNPTDQLVEIETDESKLTTLQRIYKNLVPRDVRSMARLRGEVTTQVMVELCNEWAMPKIKDAVEKLQHGLPAKKGDYAAVIASEILRKRKAEDTAAQSDIEQAS